MTATELPDAERRRSPRQLQHHPLRLSGEGSNGQRVNESAEAMVTSAHGALVKTDSELRPGSEVEVEDLHNHQRARFRVVWAMEKRLEGKWDMGLEVNSGEQVPWAEDHSP